MLAALLLAVGPASAAEKYSIDPRFGSIEFSVEHMGLFASHGWFRKFDARLTIDPAHPEHTQLTVEVDANSIDTPWSESAAMLRSPAFFDAARFPTIRYLSSDVVALGAGRYRVEGMLQMRGMTRPLILTARLLAKGRAGDSAEFIVDGMLNRTDFGMVEDRMLISDTVDIVIRARIALAATPAGG
jgi:polyisoprenoid-binding protein YceI